MPVLEMFVVMDNVYHGLRRCLGPENQTGAPNMPAHYAVKKLIKHRRRIVKSKRSLRRNRFPIKENSEDSVSSSGLKEYFTSSEFPAPMTLSRKPAITPSISLINRRRLQNRPLMSNARQVLQIQWGGFWQRCWPTLMTATMQIGCGSSVYCHSLLGLCDEEESDPPIVLLTCFLGQALKMIYNRTDLALSSNGHGPTYITTSPAMELIDIRELFQHINNALVDYLLRVDESKSEPTE
ncbi:uncharacterized protein LOC108136728 [Drosophila elegans]|uniref:uncharacterized protein LOC108136728 n=1 Tax=Drosophila elegans TaxID=30023 RepID=UPI0007E80A5D|nr:uncharacterized protein LOC108136728 [Drosophila elegans]